MKTVNFAQRIKMTFPRTHSFQANLKPELSPQDPRFCPPSPSFPFPFSPFFPLPLDLSHPWKTYPCGYLSEFCTSYKAQLKCHPIQKASQALDSKSLSPLQLRVPTHEDALTSCNSPGISQVLAAGGTLILRGHPQGNAPCRGTTKGGGSGDIRPSGEHSMETGTHTFTPALDSPNLGLLPGMGGGEMHLVNVDGFFSNRCCCQASSPNGFVLFLVFYFLH